MSATIIRPARHADLPAIARIHVDTWAHAYRDILPADFIAEKTYEKRLELWEKIFAEPKTDRYIAVADQGGAVQGWCNGEFWEGDRDQPHPPGSPWLKDHRFVHLHGIYVAPSAMRQGVGEKLFRYAWDWGRRYGCTGLRLVTLADNPYSRFYDKLGGARLPEIDQTVWGGVQKTLVIYEWKTLLKFTN